MIIVQELMIKRELAKDPKLAEEDWSRFLPKFGKRKKDRKPPTDPAPSGSTALQTQESQFGKAKDNKKKKEVVKKPYTPFPPAQMPSKVDLQLESGEYFLKAREKKEKSVDQRNAKVRLFKLEQKDAC